MKPIVETGIEQRSILAPLFASHKHDRVLIDSVLEGSFGSAWADSLSEPTVARLDSGAFTLLGGDPGAAAARTLLAVAPISYVTPESHGWRQILQKAFGPTISALRFTPFSWESLDEAYLADLSQQLPAGFAVKRVDAALAERLPADMGNVYFLECFHSVEDFLERGAGFCAIHGGKIVSAASSAAASRYGIDIDIATVAEYRKRGLGMAVGARLVLHCLQNGLEPHWLAANADSERLAARLGYRLEKPYETFEIDPQPPVDSA